MKRKVVLIVSILLIMALGMSACSGETNNTDATTTRSTSASSATSVGNTLEGYYEFRGSDSEVNLVQKLTEVYNIKQPGVQFSITGGGSGTGIAALINNQIDVANSSRPMSEKELSDAKANGVDAVEIIFAQDGLAVVINENNPIKSLTVEQIGKIYDGTYTNWKEVGGEDKAISAYGRQSTSGTFVFFRDAIVKGDYRADKKMMSGNADIVEGVKNDVAGVGYCAIGYVVEGGKATPGLKILDVSLTSTSQAYSPLELDNIMNGAYPIVRPLFHYINGKPDDALKDYMSFITSPEGEEIILEMGFYPITAEYRTRNAAAIE